MKRLAVLIAMSLAAVSLLPVVSAKAAEFSKFGIASATAGLSTTQAGAHPDFTTTIEMNTNPAEPSDAAGLKPPYGNVKDILVSLPPGLLANLNAVDTCSTVTFVTAFATAGGCPASSQVGIAAVRPYGLSGAGSTKGLLASSIYKMEATGADEVARFGFYVTTVPAFIGVHIRSDSDYGATAEVSGILTSRLVSVSTTFWGVPAATSHNTQRLTPVEGNNGATESPSRPFGRAPEPLMTNPTSCGHPLQVGFEADSYQEPGAFRSTSAPLSEITGCPNLSFEPGFSLTPSTREAAAPSGADATLTIPQNENVNGLATSHLRNTVVRLPEGVTIAAGAADGLEGCSEAQVGYKVSPPPVASCPEGSKIASVEIDSPALSRPIKGAVYQRTPEPGHLTRAWLVADELGVHVKIPGEFQLDSSSGRITSLFLDTPQVPVRQFELHFKGGPRGVLATPAACGTYQSEYRLTPWSGGADAEGNAPMTFDQRCGMGGFSPELTAGTTNPTAGAFSSFVTDLIRESGEQNVAGLSISPPPGLLANLAGVEICGDAAAPTGNCPAGSQVGITSVATGPGTSPLWIPQPGKEPTAIYLAGPYKGGPYSLVVKTPAQAGPFDLGDVVVRVALHVDPETVRVSAVSDPLPQILEGIPVSYRTIHVDLNRSHFALNPTSCDPMKVTGTATSAQGSAAALASRFQAGSCASLGFKPKLQLRLKGGTKRGANPALRATLTMPKHGANVARAQVGLPHSEFLDQAHIRTVCTRVQFAADKCPRASIYGRARAFTPLLDKPLEGPVYLRSSSHELPDLVADLRGDIRVVLAGRIDSKRGGIRTTFAAVPDAAVSKFVLEMQGGKKGLLVNSTNLCAQANRAAVSFDGQNGKVADSTPVLANSCAKKQQRKAGQGG
jgi:hypothetical protein